MPAQLPVTEPIIIGIDPAIASVGFGIIRGTTAIDYGVIKTDSKLPTWKRLSQIEEDIKFLLEKYNPAMVGMEKPVFKESNTNAFRVIQAIGVIEKAIGEVMGYPPKLLYPQQVKAAVSFGSAGKEDVQWAAAQIFGLSSIPTPDDAADGLAIAYATQNCADEFLG